MKGNKGQQIYAVVVRDGGTPLDFGEYVSIGGAFRTYEAARAYAAREEKRCEREYERHSNRYGVDIIVLPLDDGRAKLQELGGWME